VPDESEFLCGDWVWDPVLREMRHYPRRKKEHADEPDAVERLESARRVALHRWSQQPMQTATGEVMSANQSRVIVEYVDGRKLDINEPDRECARRIATTIAEAYGLTVEELGAPSGRMGGNLPKRDEMGRMVSVSGKTETKLDETAGILEITQRKRFFRKDRRELRTSNIRRLELTQETKGPQETFTVWAIIGAEEERVPIASYTGLEGWSEPDEWRPFAEDLARGLGVEVTLPGA
jgi:hypothetical protein